MNQLSLGLIETYGLLAGVEAADAAVKSANVRLVGYELSKGSGMTVIKVEGDVGAVKAAISAAQVAASKVGKIASTRVIARPSASLEGLVRNADTVGYEPPKAAPAVEAERPVAEEVPAQVPIEPVTEPPEEEAVPVFAQTPTEPPAKSATPSEEAIPLPAQSTTQAPAEEAAPVVERPTAGQAPTEPTSPPSEGGKGPNRRPGKGPRRK